MLIQFLTIATVVTLTYLFLQVLGPRPSNIFIPLSERQRWNAIIGSRFGRWMYVANVAASLTSLATVYIFFLGSSALFGAFTYISVASILLGAIVTPRLTASLTETPRFAKRLEGSDVSTVAIASLFWSADEAGRKASAVARYVTLVSISCILWLEFATFSTVASSLFEIDRITFRALILFFSVLFVFDFTFRNGLRGFIFTDLLHAPMIIIGTAVLMVGAISLALPHLDAPSHFTGWAPHLPTAQVTTFIVATIFLNSFILLTGETHWIRVWAMKNQIRKSSCAAGIVMAITWSMLIAAGLAVAASFTKVGIPAVATLVQHLVVVSPWFSVGFWLAGAAALFSTADSQLYSFLLVGAFEPATGTVNQDSRIVRRPFVSAAAVALVFSLVYAAIIHWRIEFEPIVFYVFPIFLCLVPGMVQLMRSGSISATPMLVSIGLYLTCGAAMFLMEGRTYVFSLAAPLMPALVAVVVWFRR
jgi:hypothetical protein